MARSERLSHALGLLLAVGLVATAQAQLADGFGELEARLGPATPTGAGIGIGQGEALSGSNYAPNPANFPNQSITQMSGASGASGHATSVLATLVQRAPGVSLVWSWEALDWLQGGFLRFGFGGVPLFPPATLRVFNHSWVASGEDPAVGNDVMRRFDYEITRDGVMECVGTNNGAANATPFLCSSQFNGITVGHPNGARADTPGGGRDGAGRQKPDIVIASQNTSSNSTPVASALAALLLETAVTDPAISSNPDADDPQVLKAAILAGATHGDGWTNNPALKGPDRGRTARPYDNAWGAGFLNADRSHLILTAGEQPGSSTVPAEATADPSGWSRIGIGSGTSRYWRFTIGEQVDEVVILATWPRYVPSTFTSYSLMNIDLTLSRVEGTTLIPLTGDAGLSYFASGNVVSESAVDNVELLVVRDLVPGDYVFEIYRVPGATSTSVAVAWIMPETEMPGIPGDLNGDGLVNGADLAILLGCWGPVTEPACSPSDLNSDGLVNGADLSIQLGNWTG